MKAVLCEELGGPEKLVVRDIESPAPGEGEVKVALKARGVSYVDVLQVAGSAVYSGQRSSRRHNASRSRG